MPRPSKPLIILKVYQGGDGWDKWNTRFESVASVNDWDAAAKLNWIKVILAGRAQKAFQGLPEGAAYQGGGGWDKWITRFENVAFVNDWDAAAKLNWIKVILAGRVQKAFQGLPEGARDMYDHMKAALMERLEPASKHELYNAELQVRIRKPNKGWLKNCDG